MNDDEPDDESWREALIGNEEEDAEAQAELEAMADVVQPQIGSMADVAPIFGPDGQMSKLPGFKERPGQLKMTKAVADIMNRGGAILIDAPTGIGKSVAYLVPAIRYATLPPTSADVDARAGYDEDGAPKRSARTVIVATANIALQEQVVRKDLPFLRSVLPWSFTFAIAKGISNYFCMRNYAEATGLTAEPMLGYDAVQLEKLKAWSRSTKHGDLSEFEEELTPRVRLNVTTTSQECGGKKCEYAGACFARKAREEFRNADIVVTNYHLLLADMKAENRILPYHRAVVLDEFHQLSEIARDTFGGRVSSGTFVQAARRSLPKDSDTRRDIESAAGEFFDALRLFNDAAKNDGLLDEDNVEELVEPLEALKRAVQQARGEIKDRLDADGDALTERDRLKISSAGETLIEALGHLTAAMTPSSDRNVVYFIEADEERNAKRIALCSRLVDPSEMLRRHLWKREGMHAVIGTSATLAAGPSDFEQAIADTGADDAYELEVKSPFDLASQARLVIPSKLPDPKKKDFNVQCAAIFCEVVKLAKGRTLGLFTSWQGARMAADRLRREWRDHEILLQGEAPRMQLIKRFREQVGSVLIGTSSLWEGVDVPGESLSCVVIDKLPFPHFKDPVMRRFEELDPRGFFMKQSVPRAQRAFRQGFGRLIRSETDRGVVVCLDRRIVEKGYGKKFIKAVAGVPLSRDINDVAKFLDS